MSDDLCSSCHLPPRRQPSGEKIPLRKCTRCQSVAYHDVACQKKHYPVHRLICRRLAPIAATTASAPPQRQQAMTAAMSADTAMAADISKSMRELSDKAAFVIEKRAGKGNCMIATRLIKSGQNIVGRVVDLEPLAPPVLFENRRRTHCAICFASQLERNICKDARYPVQLCRPCSELKKHNPSLLLLAEMDAIQATTAATQATISYVPRILSTAVLVYRLALRLATGQLKWEDVACMVAHPMAQDDSDAQIHQQAILVTVTLLLQCSSSSSSPSIGGIAHSTSAEQIQGILARVKVNGFTITDPTSGEPLGIGLFRTAHYMNHSCCPRVRQSFSVGVPGRLPALQLEANRNILPGEEITISYMEIVGLKREERQAELSRNYHFLCQCPLCSKDDNEI